MRNDKIPRGYRRKNGKFIILLLVGLIIILLAVVVALLIKGKKDSNSSLNQTSVLSSEVVSEYNQQQLDMIKEADEWYLRLVNFDNELTDVFMVEVTDIKAKYAHYPNMKYDLRAIDALNNMCEAAEKDGVPLLIVSSFRTMQRQRQLFNNKIDEFKSKGLEDDEAVAAAATEVAVPGTSEHNLGLAVDFFPVDNSFKNSTKFNWLSKNADEYGFILRYPEDKTDITKIIFEPWHYRYVGVQHAKEINKLEFSLEEYIEHLKNGGNTNYGN